MDIRKTLEEAKRKVAEGGKAIDDIVRVVLMFNGNCRKSGG